jgi:hydroxyacylglutathione hydrolase
VDPKNSDLKQRADEVKAQRDAQQATVPCSLNTELKTNPFLRPDDPGIRKVLSVAEGAPDVESFAAIRKHKDKF